jgi:hypothetical protein
MDNTKAVVRTDLDTAVAVDAELFMEGDFRAKIDGLGVVAPYTSEEATLQEDRCSNARAVLDREMLDVENASRDGQILLSAGRGLPFPSVPFSR